MPRLEGGRGRRRQRRAFAQRPCSPATPLPVPLQLPVVAPQHDQRVARSDRSAGGAGQHLVGGTNAAREVHVHERVVLLDVAEVEVTEVVDRVV